MTVELLPTQGLALEAEITVDGVPLTVMDAFSSPLTPLAPGPIEKPQFLANEFSAQTWEETFSGNPDCEKGLKRIRSWTYWGYGRIVGINPTVVDFGIMQLEAGPRTHDERCVGAFIRVLIDRLDLVAEMPRG